MKLVENCLINVVFFSSFVQTASFNLEDLTLLYFTLIHDVVLVRLSLFIDPGFFHGCRTLVSCVYN